MSARGFRLVLSPDVSARNPDEGDLYLTELSDLATVESDAATIQEIRSRLLLLQGENFLDIREGMPWFALSDKSVSNARRRAAIRACILTVPSIADVPVLDLLLDRETRQLAVTFEARTINGRIIKSSDFGSFILGDP